MYDKIGQKNCTSMYKNIHVLQIVDDVKKILLAYLDLNLLKKKRLVLKLLRAIHIVYHLYLTNTEFHYCI